MARPDVFTSSSCLVRVDAEQRAGRSSQRLLHQTKRLLCPLSRCRVLLVVMQQHVVLEHVRVHQPLAEQRRKHVHGHECHELGDHIIFLRRHNKKDSYGVVEVLVITASKSPLQLLPIVDKPWRQVSLRLLLHDEPRILLALDVRDQTLGRGSRRADHAIQNNIHKLFGRLLHLSALHKSNGHARHSPWLVTGSMHSYRRGVNKCTRAEEVDKGELILASNFLSVSCR
mmetsp:Transcript_33714/g.75754  ORF Transcript_33714/g.75754 Transcript_33714/m.75754 type:complete len:228 (+) Transcript_33714:329-1012(+)